MFIYAYHWLIFPSIGIVIYDTISSNISVDFHNTPVGKKLLRNVLFPFTRDLKILYVLFLDFSQLGSAHDYKLSPLFEILIHVTKVCPIHCS